MAACHVSENALLQDGALLHLKAMSYKKLLSIFEKHLDEIR